MTKIPAEHGMRYWNAASCGPWAHSFLFNHDFTLILLTCEIRPPRVGLNETRLSGVLIRKHLLVFQVDTKFLTGACFVI